MTVYFCSNSVDERGEPLRDAAVGCDRQLLIAPGVCGWHVLVLVTPDGKLWLLSVFYQAVQHEVWLLWSNDMFDQGEKPSLSFYGGTGMKFTERGQEQAYLCGVTEAEVSRLATRSHLAYCTQEELLGWLRQSSASAASASCVVRTRMIELRRAA